MNIKRIALGLIAGLMTSATTLAANTVTTVSQVTEAVTVSEDVDYTITDTTPFAITGSVNITDTAHAVVIIKNIKPSKVIKSWLGYVTICGQKAVNGTNCQVKMYGHGAIILPYSKNIKPLTVYSEQDFKGTSVNSFGLENNGGYMNTLTAAKLNNKIRSFKLKRGYMVTFSTRASGYGYSRCFIAADADLEVSSLPTILDQTISSYRVFQWYDAKKAGLASDTRAVSNDAVNSSWCYSWGLGESRLPDQECVPNHIYEDWPSSSSCGSVTYACHMKTNNEPGNSADDQPQDVETVLNNWENLMRTGLRLCSESSHDGSMSHLKAFIDSVDARGWRCDILDLHCYWAAGTFNNLNWYSSYYGNGRPIWISEWVWGASWNKNGFWGAVSDAGSLSAENQQTLYNGTKPILDVLNSNAKVERYAYWNSEAAGTHIYDTSVSGGLTTLGKYYANMNDGLGYNAANEFIPKLPPLKKSIGTLTANYDKDTQKAILKWHEYNGEYNESMTIQEMPLGSTKWEDVATVTLKDIAGDYTDSIACKDGSKFRIVIKVPTTNTGTTTETVTGNIATARSSSMEYGDPVSVVMNDGTTATKYLGGNQLINGDFSIGTADWTAGNGTAISTPYFQVMPEGGTSGSPYLQCYGASVTVTNVQTIFRQISILPNTCYFVAGNSLNSRKLYQNFNLTKGTSTSASTTPLRFDNATTSWVNLSATFENTDNDYLNVKLAGCNGNAQFDDLKACQLFDTKEDALADALTWEKKRVEAYIEYNTVLPVVNNILRDSLNSTTNGGLTANELETLLQSAMDVVSQYKQMGNTVADANTIIALALNGYSTTQTLLDCYQKAVATDASAAASLEVISKAISDLQDNVEDCLPYMLNTSSIKNGAFAAVTGWTTKAGTYTSGDQNLYTNAGKTCWNAWWSLSAAGNEDKTMAVKQELTNMDEGIYSLECAALTEHACENDQHAFINHDGTEIASSPLDFGCFDIATFSNDSKWRQMSTPFVYVNQGDAITVGFTGSKKGTVDGSWVKYGDTSTSKKGDNREGWWSATDFQLRYIPAITKVPEGNWGTVCFNYAITPQEGVQMYSLAGISADSLWVYVKPETKLEAGKPYIYYTTQDKAIFTGSGTKYTPASTSTVKINLNLYGTFAGNTKKYGAKSSALIDGKWVFNPGTSVVVPANTGYIQFTTSLSVKDPSSLAEGSKKIPLVGFRQTILGDVNNDGAVNISDVNAIISVMCGGAANPLADVNGDGAVNISDVNAVISIMCGE